MNLREIRKSRNYTQQEVADYLGCSAVVYSRYETGQRQPSIDVLVLLADFFGVTVDYLLGRNELEIAALTSYEKRLIHAVRSADERAKNDALLLLQQHVILKQEKDNTVGK